MQSSGSCMICKLVALFGGMDYNVEDDHRRNTEGLSGMNKTSVPSDIVNREAKESRRSLYISLFCFLSVFFFGMLIIWGVPVYNDSQQYIDMHVHREPVYPLFLWVMRLISEEHFMVLAAVFQCILSVVASYAFIKYIFDRFFIVTDKKRRAVLEWFAMGFVTVTVLLPYAITPLFSVTHVMLATGILSESLTMPLFLLYVIFAHRMMTDRREDDTADPRYMALSLLIAFVLSLTRSQMVVTLIAWVIEAVIAIVSGKNAKDKRRGKIIRIMVVMIVFVITIPLKGTLNRTYNQVFNGRYVDNVYTKLTMLTNVFYVTDRETGEYIDDDDLQTLFYRFYDVMDENEWSYKYSGGSAVQRAIYLEDMHDKIKFDVLEAGFRDVMNERGMPDYIDYNLKAEEYSARLLPILLPHCFVKWFADWIIMGSRGVVRSMAICHPVMYIYVIIITAFLIYGMIRCFDNRSKASFIFIALLLLFGNAFGTAFTIMCLSRYMIYGFPIVYSAIAVAAYDALYRRGLGSSQGT